jgi:23S rRNA (uridine2479-2'-O)-methyltransferase
MGVRTLPVHSENQWFQLAQTLKTNRQKRSRTGLFFVEGVRSINEMRRNPSWKVEALLYASGRRMSGWARDVLEGLPASYHLEFAAPLMDKVSDRDEGSEIIALVRIPKVAPEDLAGGGTPRIVLLDRPGNPGNLGSIVRSCDAFGATGIVITGHAVDPYDPLVVRASAGAFFSQRVARIDGYERIDSWLQTLEHAHPGLAVVGTSARAGRYIADLDLSGAFVLCFGNETTGLADRIAGRCAAMAGIPMQGAASSLNLACAVTAVLCEADRQRRARLA